MTHPSCVCVSDLVCGLGVHAALKPPCCQSEQLPQGGVRARGGLHRTHRAQLCAQTRSARQPEGDGPHLSVAAGAPNYAQTTPARRPRQHDRIVVNQSVIGTWAAPARHSGSAGASRLLSRQAPLPTPRAGGRPGCSARPGSRAPEGEGMVDVVADDGVEGGGVG